jgi:glycosyltransferase involved in cell wall biosynthesis
MTPPPYFTVVIPTYNRADLLPEAINSVVKQTFTDFEIIVVDNFSLDNTPHVMEAYKENEKIRYFRNDRNMERGYSRNVGFRNGRGAFLTLLDSDDVLYPNCLQDAYDYVQNHPNVKAFHNLHEMIDEAGRPTKSNNPKPITNQYKQICQGNFLSCIGVFLAKEVYQKFHFSEDLKMIGSEDYEIWFRVLAYYAIGRIDKVNCGVREHVGRSVYTNMYENLEYQRIKLISLITDNEDLKRKYKPYAGYINANYYFHQALFSLHKKDRAKAFHQFLTAATKGQGFLFSDRFFGFIKNFLFKR